MKHRSYYIILVLTIHPNLIYGFLFWPFYSSTEGKNGNNYDSKSLFGSFFPSISWNRSPILGISAYKHNDFGDIGEFRNDFVFRIGPKPKVITNGLDETIGTDQYTSKVHHNYLNTRQSKRYGRAEYRSFDYQKEFDPVDGYTNYENTHSIGEDHGYKRRPKEKQSSPLYEYRFNPPEQPIQTKNHELSFRIVTPKPNQDNKRRFMNQFRQPRFEYNDLVASEENQQTNHLGHLSLSSPEETRIHKDKRFDQEYFKDYINDTNPKEYDYYYYYEQELPDHILIRK